MKPAHEHPDTADVLFDVTLARIAAVFALAAFGAPFLLAAFR